MTSENSQKKWLPWVAVGALVIIGAFVYLGWARQEASIPMEVLLQNVPYDISVTAEPLSPTAGETALVEFAVKLDGQPIDLAADKVYPHVYVVSADLQDVWFYHIDSFTVADTGVYQFEHVFTQPTSYTLWIEINDNKTPDHHGQNSDYVARVAIDPQTITAQPQMAEVTNQTSAQSYLPGQSYTLQALPHRVVVGQEATIPVQLVNSAGEAVPLLPQFDHFYAIASPTGDFYVLDHPQPNEQGETDAVIGPLVFPEVGRYAIWMRLFPDDGSGQVTDAAEGVLIVDVLPPYQFVSPEE